MKYKVQFLVLAALFVSACGDNGDDDNGATSCSGDYDCQSGNYCYNGGCTWDCKTNADCSSSQTCQSNGKCKQKPKPKNCSETCSGCCDGETCMNGDAVYACGFSGEACKKCAVGYKCESYSCAVNTTCKKDSDCVASKVCSMHNACVSPWGKKWELVIESAIVNGYEKNGTAWDSWNGTPPDPYVVVQFDNQAEQQSLSEKDTTKPAWHFTAKGTIYAATSIKMNFRDADTGGYQTMDTLEFKTIEIATLRAQKVKQKYTATDPKSGVLELIYYFAIAE